MELFKPIKPVLRATFPSTHSDRADLYVYFFDRANQMLRPGGVACFISSNKWLRAGYGEPLRRHLLDAQAFSLVADFGELPVFETAATFPAIFAWEKKSRAALTTEWAAVKDLNACYEEGVRTHVRRIAEHLPATQFGVGRPRVVSVRSAVRWDQMRRAGTPLGNVVNGAIYRGVVTGLNSAFVVRSDKRSDLIAEDPASADLLKPTLPGDDIRRYEVHARDEYLIYTPHGTDIRRYPAIERHLRPHRDKLEARATRQEWFELQQPQAAFVPVYEGPKILYPDIGKEMRFVRDDSPRYPTNSAYVLGSSDWFLLGVLNSATSFEYLKMVCAVLGDEDEGGRLRFFRDYVEGLPIPDADATERAAISDLAEAAQRLHGQRRTVVEALLASLGTSPAATTIRNPVEMPWAATPAVLLTRARRLTAAPDPARLALARDETAALTEAIAAVEADIDARVAALYGL